MQEIEQDLVKRRGGQRAAFVENCWGLWREMNDDGLEKPTWCAFVDFFCHS